MTNGVTERPAGREPLRPDPPLAEWLVALSHDSPFERPDAPTARGGVCPPLSAVPGLLSLLSDSDRGVRLRVVAALGDLVEDVRRVIPEVRAALTTAAHDDDDGVRSEAVRAVLRAGPHPDTEVGALGDALHCEVDVVRFHAAVALGSLGPGGRPAVPALIHASLWDTEPAVRVGAAAALWKIDDRKAPMVVHLLAEALGDANELICWVAADYLGQMGPAAGAALPALRLALQRDFRLSLIKTSLSLAIQRIDPPARAGPCG